MTGSETYSPRSNSNGQGVTHREISSAPSPSQVNNQGVTEVSSTESSGEAESEVVNNASGQKRGTANS